MGFPKFPGMLGYVLMKSVATDHGSMKRSLVPCKFLLVNGSNSWFEHSQAPEMTDSN